jgi:hypothetical protein
LIERVVDFLFIHFRDNIERRHGLIADWGLRIADLSM